MQTDKYIYSRPGVNDFKQELLKKCTGIASQRAMDEKIKFLRMVFTEIHVNKSQIVGFF